MALIRLRITGTSEARDRVVDALEAMEGIERVEEVADLMPAKNDEDSSSAGLIENVVADVYAIEVETEEEDGDTASLVRRVAEAEVRAAGAALEIVEGF